MAVSTQEIIDKLETALSTGTKSVSYDGQTVTYNSVADLRQAITFFRNKLRTETAQPAVRVSFGGLFRD